eukprot:1187576-Prorocentrum_minimum.AAC.4
MHNSQLGHFLSVRKDLGEDLNSPVVEWLNRSLMAAWSPSRYHVVNVALHAVVTAQLVFLTARVLLLQPPPRHPRSHPSASPSVTSGRRRPRTFEVRPRVNNRPGRA